MIIDSHAHFTTAPPELDAARGRQLSRLNRPAPLKVSIRDSALEDAIAPVIERMDLLGIDVTIFSPRASGMGHEIGDQKTSLYWTQLCNDTVARACALSQGRLFPVAQLPQSPGADLTESVRELARCIDLGFIGCNINPDVSAGAQPFTPALGSSFWSPLYEAMVEFDVPGTIHASATLNPAEHMNGSHYLNADSTAAFEFCYSDTFDRYPTLRIVVPHGGGNLPYQWNRTRALLIAAARRPIESSLKNLYFDTALYDRDALALLIRTVGPERVLFATEPFGTAAVTDPQTGRAFDDVLALIDQIPEISASEREMVTSENALVAYPRLREMLA